MQSPRFTQAIIDHCAAWLHVEANAAVGPGGGGGATYIQTAAGSSRTCKSCR
jgi:hypothetical protein